MFYDFIFSILGRIIKVTDTVVKYRQWIKKTFPVKCLSGSISTSSGSEGSNSPLGSSDSVSFFYQKLICYVVLMYVFA